VQADPQRRGRRSGSPRYSGLASMALLCKKRTKYYLSSKFRQNLPCTVRYPKPTKKHMARWPTTTYTYAFVGGTTPDTHGRSHGLCLQGRSSPQEGALRGTILFGDPRKARRGYPKDVTRSDRIYTIPCFL